MVRHQKSNYTDKRNKRQGSASSGAMGAMAPVNFQNMSFGTRRYKGKHLKHPKIAG